MAFNNTTMDLEYQLDVRAESPVFGAIDLSDYFPEYPDEVAELAQYKTQLQAPRGDNPNIWRTLNDRRYNRWL